MYSGENRVTINADDMLCDRENFKSDTERRIQSGSLGLTNMCVCENVI